uniref:SRA stem-loop interacting RNA binding protein n=1 Tax=Felis catus TaxID=9685 RepID=A0ABI7XXB9_FELCA
IFFFNVYLFLGQRETEHEWGRDRERGRHRIGNRLQALSHQPRARRGAGTHGPRDCDLAEVGRLTDCGTQAPQAQGFHQHLAVAGVQTIMGELREHFAQFGHIRKCIIPFDKETGFHRGMGWIQFSSEEELQNALQQENHIIDGVKLHIQAQRPKILQGDQTSDEEKDF